MIGLHLGLIGGGTQPIDGMKMDFCLQNFCNLKAKVIEPFVFPSQVQQVFYANDPNISWWKVVFHKEARSKCIIVENSEDIIRRKTFIYNWCL